MRDGGMRIHAVSYRKTLSIAVAATLVATLGTALAVLPVQNWLLALGERLHSLEPTLGLTVFAAIYIVCSMALVPASTLSLAAGLLFGPFGIVLSWVAMVVVAAISFPLARRVLAGPVRRYVDERPRVRQVVEVIDEGGWRMVLLIRVSGIIPFGLQNYVLGTTRISFVPYLLASSVGCLPSILVYAGSGAFGSAALGQTGTPPLRFALLGVAVLAGLTLVVVTGRKVRSRMRSSSSLRI